MSGGTPGWVLLSGGSGCSSRLTIAMHDAQHDRRDHANGERHSEVVDDVGVLLPLVVVHHSQRVVLPGIVARERGTRISIDLGEVGAGHSRRIPAALDVDQEHRFRDILAGTTTATTVAAATATVATAATSATSAAASTGRPPVLHVDVTAVVHVAGATLPARAPRAVVQAGQLFATHRGTLHRFRHEIGQ